eukprot:10252329-Lingulodinium_polyedra.AAC.1
MDDVVAPPGPGKPSSPAPAPVRWPRRRVRPAGARPRIRRQALPASTAPGASGDWRQRPSARGARARRGRALAQSAAHLGRPPRRQPSRGAVAGR